jgi:hypothetical protein
MENMKKHIDDGKPLNLNDQLNAIEKGLLPTPKFPTPTSSDCHSAVKSRTIPGSKTYKHNLKEAVQMFPTPQSRDFKSGQAKRANREGKQNNLNDYVKQQCSRIGQLNADWVEALMGYPLHWTNVYNSMLICGNFPDDWKSGEWERWIPRTTTKNESRIKRLKCLGNAIVPQCAEYIFGLEAFDEWREQ